MDSRLPSRLGVTSTPNNSSSVGDTLGWFSAQRGTTIENLVAIKLLTAT
jgi:hypothetical protein